MTTHNWDNLAQKLIQSRGERSQIEVAAAAAVSVSTIQKYEQTARRDRPVRGGRQLRRLAAHYLWTPASLDRVLAGGEPKFRTQVIQPARVHPPDLTESELATFIRLARAMPARQRREAERMIADRADSHI